MSLKSVFKMPKPVKITGRSSSITNSFVNGIIPIIEPSEEEIKTALEILGMDEKSICCAYCGDTYTEWDHLRPLVVNKTATGYISEIHNLVPACGKCNQSKGNQDWHSWMHGNATLSPSSRKIVDLDERSDRLSQYEKWGTPIKVDIETIVGKYKWEKHWQNCDKIKELMSESQILSDEIRVILQKALNSNNHELTKCFFTNKDGSFSTNSHEKKPSNTHIIHPALSHETSSISLSFDTTKAIGKIVQNEFVALLKSGKIDSYIISSLQNANYSKQMFDVNFPVLLSINSKNESKKGVDHSGINRYYATPINLNGNLYLLTSQWYDRNKIKLVQWMKKFI